MFEPYFLLVVLHVVLFAYWLGADFGVFTCSRYIVRPDLPLAERERFLEALLAIDIMPRTAIVLLPFVGLQMASMRGSIDLSSATLVVAWSVGFVWLAVVWMAYLKTREPTGPFWQRIDVSWRVVLIVILWVLRGELAVARRTFHGQVDCCQIAGVRRLVDGRAISARQHSRLAPGFIRLRQGESGPDIDALFSDGRRRAKYAAFVFWALIVTMAWLGITQPY
ncbi:MAG: hypothetical protein IPG25_12555 [Proteobacteria bacterium]|nr:hypothetical protein [Pseudomonadota bacterium]